MNIRYRLVAAIGAVATLVAVWDIGPVRAEGGAHWPITGAIIRIYAPPATPYGAGHRGIDVAARVGDSVASPIEGTVTFAGSVAGRGVITVSSGPIQVTIEPVSPVVRKGAAVSRGRTIATVSATGHGVETCAHVGVRIDDVYVDPFSVLGSQGSAVLQNSGVVDDPRA